MNKLSEEQIAEAQAWVGKTMFDVESCFGDNDEDREIFSILRTLCAALDAYKSEGLHGGEESPTACPKKVTDEWVDNFVGSIRGEPFLEGAYSVVRVWLKRDFGIEVEGE